MRTKVDWEDHWPERPDMKVVHEIMAMETDLEPHGTIEDRGDLDDILAAIRSETGLSVRRDFSFESDPEAWYERGEETYEPEEPAVVSDRQIHRIALMRETMRKKYTEGNALFAAGRPTQSLWNPDYDFD